MGRTGFQFLGRYLRLLGTGADRTHLVDGGIDRGLAFQRRFGSLGRQRRHLAGGGGDFLHRCRDFFDNRRGVVDGADLFFTAHRNLLDRLGYVIGCFRRLLGTGGELLRRSGDMLGGLGDLLQ